MASTLRENMQIAANTADVLRGLRGQDEVPADDGSAREADEVFKAFAQRAQQQFDEAMSDTPAKPKRGRPRKEVAPKVDANPPALYEGNVAERISAMLREYNNPIVADAAELRHVTINKLLDLSMCGDPRIEIKATELLGKVSDVGLFTEKTEITVTYNTVSDLDQMIKDKVRKMLVANAIDVTPVVLDVDKELGFSPPETPEEDPDKSVFEPKSVENAQKTDEEGSNEAV